MSDDNQNNQKKVVSAEMYTFLQQPPKSTRSQGKLVFPSPLAISKQLLMGL